MGVAAWGWPGNRSPSQPTLPLPVQEAAEVQRGYGGRSGASAAALSPLIVLPRCSEPEGSTAQPLVNFVLANLALSQLFAPAYPAVVASPHHAEHSTYVPCPPLPMGRT